MIKKLVLSLCLAGLLFSIGQVVLAQEDFELTFFYKQGCNYCSAEKEFLDDLAEEYPMIKINRFNIASSENVALLKKLLEQYEVPKQKWGLVPATFTETRYFIGFDQEIAQQIGSCVEECLAGQNGGEGEDDKIRLPFIGEIEPAKYSLPALAIVLGFFDGFNICSLGALVLILGLVLALKERKKMLVLGSTFILTTALVYGLLIVLWYQLFSLLTPYLRIMEVVIGLLGIVGAFYFLRQFIRFKKYGPTCQEADKGIVSKLSTKLKNVLEGGGSILVLLLAVLLFALLITLVEFPCSAVIPVLFAGILSQASLSPLIYLVYIALFLLFYLIDEIIVFLIALKTMNIKLASPKFNTWLALIEAIVLFFFAAYYLFGFLIF